MSDPINVGNHVLLTAVPDWLVHDLPDDEKSEILALTGKVAVVTKIDPYGYFWLGFGELHKELDGAHHYRENASFCVSRECLELIHEQSAHIIFIEK